MTSPNLYEYDYGLGTNASDEIAYILESMEVQSRISPTKCYLLFRSSTGSVVGSASSLFTVSSYTATDPNYRATIWSAGANHPDIRPYTNSGAGSISVYINSVAATRVIDVTDLLNDNEFAVVKRYDLNPARVELVFNTGFNASGSVIQYYYSSLNMGIDVARVKRGEDTTQSMFGWVQYLNAHYDDFRGKNQILVRLPLTTRDLVINEEGKVMLEENDSWCVASPYINDFDILIIPSSQTMTGVEERYEVVNKKDSVIQGTLITQRFKLKFLEYSDSRYSISYIIT
jgi:hypothetical protein